MTRVLVTDHVFPNLDIERAVLDPLGVELVEAENTDQASLAELAAEVDGILVCFAPLPAEVIDVAGSNRCRIIARYGIGYDNVSVEAATRNGIVVTNVPDYCLEEVADHTMALLLSSARGIVPAARTIEAGGWEIDFERIRRLRGRRLSVIGLGAIGRKVVERSLPFGLEITGFDPYVGEQGVDGVEMVDTLEEAVAEADFISLHLPVTEETENLVDADLIGSMRRQPLLINTARGGLVDLGAATEALEDGRLSGLALDVTVPEPLPEGHPLRSDPKAIVTPHVAFHSVEATEELQRRAVEEVRRALEGEPPDCPVNREVLAGFQT